jgi:hypothetical protein
MTVEQRHEHAETLEEEHQRGRRAAPPITSRVLFVNVAAKRAKQLRRGAKPRLDADHAPVLA